METDPEQGAVMPIPVANGDYVESRVSCRLFNQISYNVRHWLVSGVSATSPTLLDLATKISADVHAPYKGIMSSQASFIGVGVRRIIPAPVTQEEGYAGDTGDGAVTSDALPPQVTGILSLRTTFAGPRYRGRVYLPFPPETMTTLIGLPLSTYITAAGALASFYSHAHSYSGTGWTATINPVLRSRKYGTFSIIVDGVPKAYFGTQRRRGYASGGDFTTL